MGLSGHGKLIDWEIFNQPDQGRLNGFSHFSIRAEAGGKVEVARILQGAPLAEKGVEPESRCGGDQPSALLDALPHFSKCTFNGEFPVAELSLTDKTFPGRVKLTAFSHFVPGDSFLASFPGAYYEIEVTNSTQSHLNYACCGVIANPWTSEKSVNRVTRHHGKTFLELLSGASPDALEYGQLALATDAEKVSCQEYWRRGSCSESLKDYWNDLTTSGAFVNRACETGVEAPLQSDHGLLAAHFHLAPGEKHRVRFVLTWYVPNRSYTRDPQPEGKLSRNGIKTKKQWRNYYARLMPSAFSFANRLLGSYAETRRRVFLFRKTLYSSTIPQYSLEGAGANLAVLVSPACLRLENGTFWGWEGDGAGMCQHVWNYAQAMALLFPDLERSIRRSHA